MGVTHGEKKTGNRELMVGQRRDERGEERGVKLPSITGSVVW